MRGKYRFWVPLGLALLAAGGCVSAEGGSSGSNTAVERGRDLPCYKPNPDASNVAKTSSTRYRDIRWYRACEGNQIFLVATGNDGKVSVLGETAHSEGKKFLSVVKGTGASELLVYVSGFVSGPPGPFFIELMDLKTNTWIFSAWSRENAWIGDYDKDGTKELIVFSDPFQADAWRNPTWPNVIRLGDKPTFDELRFYPELINEIALTARREIRENSQSCRELAAEPDRVDEPETEQHCRETFAISELMAMLAALEKIRIRDWQE